MNAKEAAELQEEATELLQLWERYGADMESALYTDHAITPDLERAFLERKSQMSRAIKSVGGQVPKILSVGETRMLELIKQSTSLRDLHALPEVDKPALTAAWHKQWIQLLHSVGGIEFISRGGQVRSVTAAASGIAAIKGGGRKKKKKSKMVYVYVIVALAAAAGAYVFFFS